MLFHLSLESVLNLTSYQQHPKTHPTHECRAMMQWTPRPWRTGLCRSGWQEPGHTQSILGWGRRWIATPNPGCTVSGTSLFLIWPTLVPKFYKRCGNIRCLISNGYQPEKSVGRCTAAPESGTWPIKFAKLRCKAGGTNKNGSINMSKNGIKISMAKLASCQTATFLSVSQSMQFLCS